MVHASRLRAPPGRRTRGRSRQPRKPRVIQTHRAVLRALRKGAGRTEAGKAIRGCHGPSRGWGTGARAHSAPFSDTPRRQGFSVPASGRRVPLLFPAGAPVVAGSATYSGQSAQRSSGLARERAVCAWRTRGPERVGAGELGKGGGGGTRGGERCDDCPGTEVGELRELEVSGRGLRVEGKRGVECARSRVHPLGWKPGGEGSVGHSSPLADLVPFPCQGAEHGRKPRAPRDRRG